jgi:predicted secreted hydrolase
LELVGAERDAAHSPKTADGDVEMIGRYGWLGLVLALLVGCAPVVHRPLVPVTPVPTPTPHPIRLPADDAPHNDLTEWWYYTGHLTATDGQQYGFEFVIFQVERKDAPIYYAAHFAITDHQRREFHYDQRTWTVAKAPTSFDIGTDGWRMSGNGQVNALKASMPSYAIDLTITPLKPPTFHGNDGVVSFGPAGDSYYYSDTRLAVEGSVDDHGVPRKVQGIAWKDRQWGNFVTGTGGWDWFSVQLDDGTDLMLFLLRGPLGQTSPAYGTLVPPDGPAVPLKVDAAHVAVADHWTSPHTDAIYPSGWSIDLPANGMQLELTPVLRDQELDTRATTGQIYWEGEVAIHGENLGRPVTGQGYVELTGYAKGKT